MRTAAALTILLALAAPAMAQDVTVNASGNGMTLIDPATGQTRYVPPLLQPWQVDAIRLRPPGHHKRAAKAKPAVTTTAPADTVATTEPTPLPPPAPKKPRRVAAAPAPAAPQPAAPIVQPAAPKPPPPKASTPLSGFADIDLITGTGQQAAAPKKAAPAKAVPAKAAPAPVERTASIEKPKAKTPSGNRKDSIIFAPNATDPSSTAVAAVRTLAGTLGAAIGDGSSRVQLMAYAGQRGEKSSDTRRMSLKRALVIRQLLIDDGVPSERIDVFALGGADDDGALDRVDVFVKS